MEEHASQDVSRCVKVSNSASSDGKNYFFTVSLDRSLSVCTSMHVKWSPNTQNVSPPAGDHGRLHPRAARAPETHHTGPRSHRAKEQPPDPRGGNRPAPPRGTKDNTQESRAGQTPQTAPASTNHPPTWPQATPPKRRKLKKFYNKCQ